MFVLIVRYTYKGCKDAIQFSGTDITMPQRYDLYLQFECSHVDLLKVREQLLSYLKAALGLHWQLEVRWD